MIIRFILWINRCWLDLKESKEPHIKLRNDWTYNRKGDYRRVE